MVSREEIEQVRAHVEAEAARIYGDAEACAEFCDNHGPIYTSTRLDPTLADCIRKVASVCVPPNWQYQVLECWGGDASLMISWIEPEEAA